MEWMDERDAPKETDVILCLTGRPPVIAAKFDGEWLMYDFPEDPLCNVIGFKFIP